ncbi:MAG: hypothetical protein IJU66_07680 [Oscillospiraceae bacterium]|nr:hypothetical protein [Oscillospiraceae bacterium]
MKLVELAKTIERLKHCEEAKKRWSKEAEAIKGELVRELDRRKTESLRVGQSRIERTRYTRVCVNTEALKTDAPDVYERFAEPREVVTVKVV